MGKEKFCFLDSLATADFAFEAFGERPEELFESAALALESVIVNLDGVRGIKSRKLRIEGESLENLLFDFLSELIYLQSAEGLVFSSFDIKIDKEKISIEITSLDSGIDIQTIVIENKILLIYGKRLITLLRKIQ